jgi:cell division protein FtsB
MIEHASFALLVGVTIVLFVTSSITAVAIRHLFLVLEKGAEELRSLYEQCAATQYDLGTIQDELDECKNELRRLGEHIADLEYQSTERGNNLQQAIGDVIVLITRHVLNGKHKQ